MRLIGMSKCMQYDPSNAIQQNQMQANIRHHVPKITLDVPDAP